MMLTQFYSFEHVLFWERFEAVSMVSCKNYKIVQDFLYRILDSSFLFTLYINISPVFCPKAEVVSGGTLVWRPQRGMNVQRLRVFFSQ